MVRAGLRVRVRRDVNPDDDLPSQNGFRGQRQPGTLQERGEAATHTLSKDFISVLSIYYKLIA